MGTEDNLVAHYLEVVLPAKSDRYRHNPVQVQYATSISKALAGGPGKFNFIEGDAGIGKSLAYLLMVGDWVARGIAKKKPVRRQAVIATYSRALQRQLLDSENQDILADYLAWAGLPSLTMGLRMGRNNYVAPHRLAQALGVETLEGLLDNPKAKPRDVSLARWALNGGLLHDLADDALPEGVTQKDISMHPSDPLPESLAAAFENTAASDIQVINHALLALDLVQGNRLTGTGAPCALLVDEAEHYPAVAEAMLSDSMSLWMISGLLKQHRQFKASEFWVSLFQAWTNEGLAGHAQTLSHEHRSSLTEALDRLIRAKPTPAATAELKHDLAEARDMARRVRAELVANGEGIVLSYSPERGFPSIVVLNATAGATLRISSDQRTTLLTSATLSDLKHQPGEPPAFEYLRRRLLLPAANEVINMARSHQALEFGRLTFRLPGLEVPVLIKSAGDFMLNPAFAEGVWKDVEGLAVTGRTILLCGSYRDVDVLAQKAPAALASRVITHGPGAAVNDIAQEMPEDGILLSPAGWEGLSPKRGSEAFWAHVGIVRNPTPRPDPVKALVLQRHLARQMPRSSAERAAKASLSIEGQVQTLHKLRQGLGRALRHPDDKSTVTLYDPRFPLSETGDHGGVKKLRWLSGAVPFRFRAALAEAQQSSHKPQEKKPVLLL